MAERELTGGCRCGDVRFRVTGAPIWVGHCHCTSCRKATASAMTTYAGFDRKQVVFEAGTPARYGSSPGVTRGFCGRCGTPLSYEGARWPEELHLFLCTFDDPAVLAPTFHVYTAEQVPWLHLADDLPRHPASTSGD